MTENHIVSATGLSAMSSFTPNSVPTSSSSSLSTSSSTPVPASSSSSSTASQFPLRVSPSRFHFSPSRVMPGQFAKLKLANPTTSPIGFKFKTNAQMKYSVKPVLGIVPAGETIKISVRSDSWISPQDRFLLQSVSLTKDEADSLTSTTWRTLDRTRFSECYIPCVSSSALSLKDPEDDLGSLSSSSASSSTTASSSYTPPFHAWDWQPQQQQQHPRHQQVFERWQHSESMRPTVSIGGLGRRPSSSSSTCSSAPSSPGSYPTLFLSSPALSSSCSTSPTSAHHPPKLFLTPAAMPLAPSSTSRGLFIPSTIPEEVSSPTTTTATVTTMFSVIGSKESKAKLSQHQGASQHISRSRRIMDRAILQLQGLREYSRTQLLALALVCLWIGIMFPFSRVSGLIS